MKKLVSAAKSEHPELEWHFKKHNGIVSVGWDRVAQVRPSSDSDSCQIFWLHDAADSHQVDKAAVSDKFTALSAAADASSLPWSL